jgi:hypothetical protein
MVTSAQAVLGIGVLFLAAVIFRMRLIRMAQALLARSCPTPLGQALSWRLELLVCTRKHGLDISTLFSDEIIHIQYLPFPFPFIHITRFARVGRTIMLYASVIQMCYSVFFYPHVTLEFSFYTHNVPFFFTIQNLLCVFLFYLLYYLSMSWLFIQVFFLSLLTTCACFIRFPLLFSSSSFP